MVPDGKKVAPMLSDRDVVALLTDRPADRLARGQVGTVVETISEWDVRVEFNDEHGRAYAVVPCARADLLHLRTVPLASTDPQKAPRQLGRLAGQIHVPDDFDDPLPDDIIALFEGR